LGENKDILWIIGRDFENGTKPSGPNHKILRSPPVSDERARCFYEPFFKIKVEHKMLGCMSGT
jgi:hypothetical protein